MGNVALSLAARTLSAHLLDEIDDLAAEMAVKYCPTHAITLVDTD